MAHPFKADDSRARLLAKLIREILNSPGADGFEDLADLVGALKYRCGRLHIGWTNDDIAAALRLVVSNCPLPRRASDATFHVKPQRDEGPRARVSRAEASAILQRLGVKL
jgi:hypothetical protein